MPEPKDTYWRNLRWLSWLLLLALLIACGLELSGRDDAPAEPTGPVKTFRF
jgi:outer membrane lipopolysaccharide assembly protein LptE/RlpB